jgi:hypothetical protein
MKIKLLGLAVLAASVTSAPLFALTTTSFSEDFSSATQGLTQFAAGQFYTIGGTNIDVISGSSDGYLDAGHQNPAPSQANVVDMGGTGGLSLGELQTEVDLAAGTYVLSVEIAGSQRAGYDPNGTLTGVNVGTTGTPATDTLVASSIKQSAYASAETKTYSFTSSGAPVYVTFSLLGTDNSNVGSLLERVSIEKGSLTPTPEPNTLLMLGSGFAALAGLARRKFAAHRA